MRNEREILEKSVSNLKKVTGIKHLSLSKVSSKLYDFVIKIDGNTFIAFTEGSVLRTNFLSIMEKIAPIKSKYDYPVILVANYVSPALINNIIGNGLNYLDSAGNCNIAAKGLCVHVSGEKHNREKEIAGVAFNEAGLKLISFFLTEIDNVSMPYRDISKETGISLGTINNVIEDLKNRKFIFMADGKRKIMNRPKLIEQWIVAYNNSLKPKLLVGRMDFIKKEDADNWRCLGLSNGDVWGGEPAAYFVDGFLKPEYLTIYSSKSTGELSAGLKLKPSKDGRIFVYRKFWEQNDNERIAPVHIIYADLMGSGDSRCLEAAQRLLKHENKY